MGHLLINNLALNVLKSSIVGVTAATFIETWGYAMLVIYSTIMPRASEGTIDHNTNFDRPEVRRLIGGAWRL